VVEQNNCTFVAAVVVAAAAVVVVAVVAFDMSQDTVELHLVNTVFALMLMDLIYSSFVVDIFYYIQLFFVLINYYYYYLTEEMTNLMYLKM
jgi:hypothetical protein